MESASRRRLGRALGRSLIGIGLLVIVVSVLWVLEAANGPGAAPRTFAGRRSYDQVKESVHRTFPLAFVVGMGGLGVAMLGARLARRSP